MSKSAQLISAAPFPGFSRLSPHLPECLSALHCLPNFIQYLEYCKSIRLLHFLFACETFRDVAEKSSLDPAFESNCNLECSHQIGSPTKSIKSSVQHDALDIYIKYISMNAPHPIALPENVRQNIENQISTEDGNINFVCFDGAVSYIKQCLISSFIPRFHQSSFCTAYQLEVFSKDICLADIIMWDTTLIVFMEFLEQTKNENHVLFWVSVETFQRHLRNVGSTTTMGEVGSDAIALYDTYLSLQARKPVNYGRIIRGIVESGISPDDGVITPAAFQIAQQYCYHYMDKFFFPNFRRSETFRTCMSDMSAELAERRKTEATIISASRDRLLTPNAGISKNLETLSLEPPSSQTPSRDAPGQHGNTTPRDTLTTPRDTLTTPRDAPGQHGNTTPRDTPNKSPGSSYRSSPTSSKTSSPQARRRPYQLSPSSSKTSSPKSHAKNNSKQIETDGTLKTDVDDILDDSNFFAMPTCDYRIGAVDEWGVYQTEDKHLLDSPAQGSDIIKKSVLKLFGKEELSEEDAMAKAKSIIAGVMNLTTKPMEMASLLSEESEEDTP